MKTNQPAWLFHANLGDVNPFERGRLLYIDKTGVYDPELVYFDDDLMVRRFSCGRCTMQRNDWRTISDNHYHTDKPAWFADKLQSMAETYGARVEDVARALCGSDPVERALWYDNLAGYFGVDNFDSYPVQMTRAEIRRKYRAAF